jgi:hypothetical protein
LVDGVERNPASASASAPTTTRITMILLTGGAARW